MRRFILALLVAAGGIAPPAVTAQVLDTQQVTANSSGGGCTAVAGSCASFQMGSAPSVTLQVSGTFVGTLSFEATSDGVNWITVFLVKLADGTTATTTTGTGSFAFTNSGVLQIRTRATAWTSGTAVVTATRGWALYARNQSP